MYTVRNILEEKGREVWTVTPETPVLAALGLMADKGVGALPVLYHDRLVGLFSERDYARKAVLKGKTSSEALVKDIMSFRLQTVGPDTPAEECMALMTEKRVRYLPVLDDGKLAGLISIGDVVKSVVSKHSNTIEQLENYIRGNYR